MSLQPGWFKSYGSTLIQLIVFIVLMALQWANFAQAVRQTEENRVHIQRHLESFDRHIDPERDRFRWDDVIRRMDRIERKLDER